MAGPRARSCGAYRRLSGSARRSRVRADPCGFEVGPTRCTEYASKGLGALRDRGVVIGVCPRFVRAHSVTFGCRQPAPYAVGLAAGDCVVEASSAHRTPAADALGSVFEEFERSTPRAGGWKEQSRLFVAAFGVELPFPFVGDR